MTGILADAARAAEAAGPPVRAGPDERGRGSPGHVVGGGAHMRDGRPPRSDRPSVVQEPNYRYSDLTWPQVWFWAGTAPQGVLPPVCQVRQALTMELLMSSG